MFFLHSFITFLISLFIQLSHIKIINGAISIHAYVKYFNPIMRIFSVLTGGSKAVYWIYSMSLPNAFRSSPILFREIHSTNAFAGGHMGVSLC